MKLRRFILLTLTLTLCLSFASAGLAASDNAKFVSQLQEAENIILAYRGSPDPGGDALAAMGQSKTLKDFDIERFGKLITTYLRYNSGIYINDLVRDYGRELANGGVRLSSCGTNGSPEAVADSARASIAWRAIELDKIKPQAVSAQSPCFYVDGSRVIPTPPNCCCR